MAKILNTTLEEIYEPEYGVYVINCEYAHGNFENNGTFIVNSEFVFDTMQKYIQKLEEEKKTLKTKSVEICM